MPRIPGQSIGRALAGAVVVSTLVVHAAAVAQAPPPPSQAALELAARLIGSNGKPPEPLSSYADRFDIDLRRALVTEANRLTTQGRLDEALRGYELAAQVADRIGDRSGVAGAALGMGTIHGRRGDFQAAAEATTRALAIGEAIGDQTLTASALSNLGVVRKQQGEYEAALEYYGRSLALAEKLGQRAAAARTLNNIGGVHMLRGNYREALDYLQRSARLKEETKQTADLSTTLSNIGGVHDRLGDFDLALEYYRRAIDAAEQAGNRAATGPILLNLGRAYANHNQYDTALGYLRRALGVFEAAGQKPAIADTLEAIGSTNRDRGDLKAAVDDLRRSLAIHEDIHDRLGAADTLVELAAAVRRSGDASGARDAARRAGQLAAAVGSWETLWHARVAEGEADEAMRQTDEAFAAYQEAADIVEENRGATASSEQERQRYLELRLQPFHGLVRTLVGRGRIAEALAAAEHAKARVLLDVLRDGRADVGVLTLDERERQRQLERDLAAARARLRTAETSDKPNPDAVAAQRAAWENARAADAEFRTSLYAAHPALKLSRGDAEAGSVRDLESLVADARTALVEFLVTPDATYAFVARRAGAASELRIDALTIRVGEDRLGRDVERFRRHLAARDLDFQQDARNLYRTLLDPVRDAIAGRTMLVIVPDGPLWEVPFEALQPRAKHFLVEDAAVSLAPSIAVLREMRARRERDTSGGVPTLLAFGDPAGPGGRLPEAARQVELLRGVYGADRSQILEGEAASERRFVSSAGRPTVVHLATHGVLDDASPMYSFLQLAGDASGDPARDGRLEAWEIMKLDLRPAITVLAACETARGRIGGGEGVIGLSWAFFLAGSPRTVVSLWNVDAASTTDLMVAFHRRVRAHLVQQHGRPAAAASLRAAALLLLQDPKYRHPFYWAGFVVLGDGS